MEKYGRAKIIMFYWSTTDGNHSNNMINLVRILLRSAGFSPSFCRQWLSKLDNLVVVHT